MIKKFVWMAVAAAIFFTCGLWVAGRPGTAPKITSDLVSSRLEDINELAMTEYHYTAVGKYENRLDFYGWEVPLTLKRFIISYDGTITAGIDLEKAKVKTAGNSIEVSLPAAEMLSHEIDLNSITVFDETKNIFNPIQITDYIKFSKDQKDGSEQEAVDKGLLTEAQKRACDVVTQWLKTVYGRDGGDDLKIKVIVQEKEA